MNVMKMAPDFFDIQKEQWRKSLFLLAVLIVFYFVLIVLLTLAFTLILGFFTTSSLSLSNETLTKILAADAVLALIVALFHMYDARRNGADIIRERLQAKPPDREDRYHRIFINTVEEMRIASGLPRTIPLVIPSFAINSMAIIESAGMPVILVTEGLLAELTREELQAVIAHEIAHITRGDSFYLTLVCSLANFFERMRQALEVEDDSPDAFSQSRSTQTVLPLASLALFFSSIIMHLLSTLISRQREILADAAAVEICRNPQALARSIYQAQVKNSFVGDFHLTYSPLFIVPPESKSISEGFLGRLFNSHPPLLQRIDMLSRMASTTPAAIFQETQTHESIRKRFRPLRRVRSESAGTTGGFHSIEFNSGEAGDKQWKIRHPDGTWIGPLSIEELLSDRFFTPLIQIENIQENVRASARDFPHIRNALRAFYKKRPINPARANRCPHCGIQLKTSDYEGVAIKECQKCGGVLVKSACVDRIIARREIGFSPELKEKAEKFRKLCIESSMGYPLLKDQRRKTGFCPACTGKMTARPFNYSYVVPVDKCLSCGHIWFDADELEILQILIEDR